MEITKAINVIYRSLTAYIEDSAGACSQEAEEIDKAYNLVNKVVSKDLLDVDAHDVGMIACIIASNLWDEAYEKTPDGSMNTYDLISQWAIEFHKTYEGHVNWGEEDHLIEHGFTRSCCWDEAVMEFAQRKIDTFA